jgi:outer membrane receptor protein involved in Fe transport
MRLAPIPATTGNPIRFMPIKPSTSRPLCLLLAFAGGAVTGLPVTASESAIEHRETISEVIVTAQRREQPRFTHHGNVEKIDFATLERAGHQHVSEVLNRVAGTWVVRGSGQEHQTAIRSPVLGGGGACGGYLVLEDGVPIRPAHFCNGNQFIEVASEQAASIEVIRGPGGAPHGSNAVHGIVNVLMPAPGRGARPMLALEAGANDFVRARAALPFDRGRDWLLAGVYANDGGFRAASGYRQGKLHLKGRGTWGSGDLVLGFTATGLAQDTAGFVYGKDAYRDPAVAHSNPDAGAFRDASSQRVYASWSRSLERFAIDLRPYARHSDMRFMHHALPGKPIEDNGHASVGLLATATSEGEGYEFSIGADLEWSDLRLRQTQAGPAPGSARVRATRPAGRHYDYTVGALTLAAFARSEFAVGERLGLAAGLRLEHARYDYRNRMLAGNTRDDGTPCGFGGCLYTRPEDRSDRFDNLGAKLSASYRTGGQGLAFASLARGFRAPQALELYRLQNGQTVADLDSERIDSLEFGWRTLRDNWSGEVVAYAMHKRDSVFRDSDGFNVSGARSRHLGIEAAIDARLASAWWLALDGSYARHTYDFDYRSSRGESFVKGLDMDTAPRRLGSAELRYEPGGSWRLGLQWNHLGPYFLDAGNRHRYPGHSLLNFRAGYSPGPGIDLLLRLNNLTDRDHADRADFGGGDYRYLPGRGRELFLEWRYTPPPGDRGSD